MREIKFRAWDTDKKLLSPVWDISFKGWDECEINSVTLEGDGTYMPDNFIIEQYTGLKDKNGVEIYEGDILQNSHMDDYPCRHSIVEWDSPCPTLRPIGTDKRRPITTYGWIDIFSVHYGGVEVIGNIHMNPELL